MNEFQSTKRVRFGSRYSADEDDYAGNSYPPGDVCDGVRRVGTGARRGTTRVGHGHHAVRRPLVDGQCEGLRESRNEGT